MILSVPSWTLPQQSGQTGSPAGGGSGGSGRSSSSRPGTSSRTTPSPQPQQQRQRTLLVITGTVVLEDGTPPPPGAVIERACFGRTKKEAYPDSKGNFGFQLGVAGNIIPDASEDSFVAQGSPWSASVQPLGIPSRFSPTPAMELSGCELRAQLSGYRSSVVVLSGGQTMGQIDVGTIVLHPVAKVPGTVVSAVSLQAPKGARKALGRAEKSFKKKRFEEAEKDLKMAVAAFPRYATAWFALGRLYQQWLRGEDARTAFSKAVEADRNYVNPYIELARLAAVEQKWRDVADITDRALALDPLDFPEGFFLNSLANYSLGNPDAAERSARKAQRLDSLHRFPQAHLILASLLRRKGDVAGEREQLHSYLKYAPGTPNAARVSSRLEELDRAGNPD